MKKLLLAISLLSTLSLACSPLAFANNEDFNAHCTLRNINVQISGNSTTFPDLAIDSVTLNFTTITDVCEYGWHFPCPWPYTQCEIKTVQHIANNVSESLRQLCDQNNITGNVQRAQTGGYLANTHLHPVICKRDDEANKTIDETVASYTLIYNDSTGQSHDVTISGDADATNATITINRNDISDVTYNG